jgi:hypothetical protein
MSTLPQGGVAHRKPLIRMTLAADALTFGDDRGTP